MGGVGDSVQNPTAKGGGGGGGGAIREWGLIERGGLIGLLRYVKNCRLYLLYLS